MVKRFRTRRGPKARQSRKMGVKRAARVMSRKKYRQRKTNGDTFAVTSKIDYIQRPYTTSGTVNISGLVPILSNSDTPVTPQNTKEYVLYSKLYDQVRINRVTVRVKPVATDIGWATAANAGKGDSRVHCVIDRNSVPPVDVPSFQQYPSYKSFGLTQSWKRSYAVTYPKGIWLQTTNLFTDAQLLTNLGLDGVIAFCSAQIPLPAAQILPPWAALEVSYHMVFRGRKSVSINANVDGSVRLQPTEQFLDPIQLRGYTIVGGTTMDGATDDEPVSQQEE